MSNTAREKGEQCQKTSNRAKVQVLNYRRSEARCMFFVNFTSRVITTTTPTRLSRKQFSAVVVRLPFSIGTEHVFLWPCLRSSSLRFISTTQKRRSLSPVRGFSLAFCPANQQIPEDKTRTPRSSLGVLIMPGR